MTFADLSRMQSTVRRDEAAAQQAALIDGRRAPAVLSRHGAAIMQRRVILTQCDGRDSDSALRLQFFVCMFRTCPEQN